MSASSVCNFLIVFLLLAFNVTLCFTFKSKLDNNGDDDIKKPVIFIVTYFRSGSSFLGDLLQQADNSFYFFEPLRYLTLDQRISEQNKGKAFAVIESLVRCNFTKLVQNLGWSDFRFTLRSKQFTNNSWVRNASLILNIEQGERMCRHASRYVFKFTRLHMEHLDGLLQRLHESVIKVIYLTRDPRGISNSRHKERWCQEKCKSIKQLCYEMADDLLQFDFLKKKYPRRLFNVRFEDLALRPFSTSELMFNQLNIPITTKDVRFLYNHTQITERNKVYANSSLSTFKNSNDIAYKWMHEMRKADIEESVKHCRFVLDKLQYVSLLDPVD